MANITNNFEPGSCHFEAGSTQNGDVTISDCTIEQHTAPQVAPKDKKNDVEHYTQRQMILLFTELMDIPLCSDTNIKGFAEFIAKVGGWSAEGVRKKINDGFDYEDEGVIKEREKIAADIRPFSEEWAEKMTK